MIGFTPSAGAAPGLPAISRRTLLRASPALLAPAFCALPASAAATETPILAAFRDYEAAEVRWAGVPDDQSDALYAEVTAIKDRLLALPCEGPLDLAAKLVVDTCYGDFGPGEALVAECEAMLARALA